MGIGSFNLISYSASYLKNWQKSSKVDFASVLPILSDSIQTQDHPIHFSGRRSRTQSPSEDAREKKRIKRENPDSGTEENDASFATRGRGSRRTTPAKRLSSSERRKEDLYAVPQAPTPDVFQPEPLIPQGFSDYQMQIMQLEQKNKGRLRRTRAEEEAVEPVNRVLTPGLEGRINQAVNRHAYDENKDRIPALRALRAEIMARYPLPGIQTAVRNAVPLPPVNDPRNRNSNRRQASVTDKLLQMLTRP